MKKNTHSQKTVYNFLTPIKMKFKSPIKLTDSEIKPPSVLTKIKSFTWLSSKNIPDQSGSLTDRQNGNPSSLSSIGSPLQFIKKLTNEHFLVGNAYRVDAMYLGGIIDDFIDTEYLWSLDFKKGIMNVAVDIKKSFLAFLLPKQVHIYQYNLKKSKEVPVLLTTIDTFKEVKFIQFAKESHLTLFYENSIQIYYVDENLKKAKKKFSKQYNQPEEANIFQVPQAFEGVINIFFTEPKAGTSMFHLWNLEIRLQKEQITMGSFLKIYDISNGLREKIVLSNYSKEIFCMNLGHQILAVKKGYIIDTVNSNIENDYAVLRYLGNDKLIHVLSQKVELYRFSLNMNLNPPRIILESTDSIWSKINDQTYVFLQVLQMLTDNIVVFYQVSEQKNNSLSGQIKYAFNVTQKVKFQDKIRDILPSPQDLFHFKDNPNKKISDQDYELIEEKVDMAMKMGLNRKQIYLRLWNNSTKCDIVDYQFLLDTMDYDTIRAQIENKLKKKSMVLRQVIKIQEGCIAMLQTKAFSNQVNCQYLKNFLISHFLLRKLKLYQMFSVIEKQELKLKKSKSNSQQTQRQESQTIMINIKDYVGFAKCDLKAVLLELIRQLCLNKKDTILKIRTLIKLFRFSFRPIYSHLLQDIIKQAGSNLLVLLQSIPEILPYQHKFIEEPNDFSLYEGIWGNIQPQEWQSNLYVGGISTIDNRQIVQEMKKSVWAKRFFLTLHDLLPYQKAEILQIHQNNKAQQTFYNFIQKIFDCIKEKSNLSALISFIENNYQKLPRHLVGHIFLYKALYDYLKGQNALKPRLQKGQFNEFLKLKDYEICKLIFDLQKRKKNCILKDVKQGIYNSPDFSAIGNDIFNLALLNFFSSDLSQISDIKYLLNRLNNQKYEFHSENQGMYEVIVKGMQAKLYLGSEHDIPIDEVYIYISNIHIEADSEIKKDLKYLDIINKHSQKLKKVRLNMSVFQIIRQMQKVLSILVNYEVQQRKIMQKTDENQILKESLQILETIQNIKNQIYFQAQKNKNLVFFIYLTKILERQEFISKVKDLITCAQIIRRYDVQEIFIENAVIYMYKKKFSEDKIYKHNQTYIKELLKLLPEGNQTRQFISDEVQLGITLSCDGNLLEYPIGGSNAILSTVQLESAINCLSGEVIKEIDFYRIYHISLKMQQLSSDGQISSISLYQIYEIVILRLLQCNSIKQCIPYIRKIMELNPLNPYNFIYPVILIKKFTSQLCDQNRTILLMILTYQFQHPDQLLDIVESLLNTKCTSLEQKIILKGFLRKVQGSKKTYDKNNPIFDQDYLEGITSQKKQKAFASILRKSLIKITQIKDQFLKNPQYIIIYTILLNNPYGVVKYLYCSRYESNFKGIRCFFSYLNKQEIFNKTFLLELGKRIFKILHQGLSQTAYIQEIIDKYQSIPLSVNLDIEKIKPDSNLSTVMSKSVERFRNKLKQELNKKKNLKQQKAQERKARIQNKLSSQSAQVQQVSNEYPFQDSDNEFAGGETKLKKIETNESVNVEFDPIFQRQLLMTRNQKSLGLYLSQEFTAEKKQLFYSRKMQLLEIKNSVVKLKNKKKELQDEYNLRLSVKNSVKQIKFSDDEKVSSRNQSSLRQIDSIELTQSYQGTHIQQNLPKRQVKSQFFTLKQKQHETSLKQPEIKKESAHQNSSQKISVTNQTNFKNGINTKSQQKNETKIQDEKVQAESDIKIIPQNNLQNQSSQINFDVIIDKLINESEGENFNINAIKETEMDSSQFKTFITKLYQSDKLTSSQAIAIIKKLSLSPTPAPIFKDNLEVFVRMDSFQKRFSLDIDLKKMLPIQGIFIESKNMSEFFQFFKQNIISMLSESNVYKITKVISLAFKSNQIEQQLNVEFLINWLKQLQTNPIQNPKDLARQKQKIKAFTQKIAVQHLNSRDNEILGNISNIEFKTEIIDTIVQAMRKKKNEEMAETFVQKWKTV